MLPRLVVKPGSPADLERRDPRDTLGLPGKDEAKEQLATLLEELSSLQERLYAEGKRSVLLILQGLDASGKDVVFLETVGVGQAEVDIIDHADTVVLVLMPGSGDSIQALKAGLMEIPDVIAVNKSDHPLADTMVREIRGVLSLGPQEGWRVPIVKTEASRGEGIEELGEKMAAHREFIDSEGTLAERRRRNLMNEVVALAAGRLRRRLETQVKADPAVQELLDEVVSRRLDPASAAAKLLEREGG